MSMQESVAGIPRRRWPSIATAALLALSALFVLALIPVVFFDPDATPVSSATASFVIAVINGVFALVAFTAWRTRAALIMVAVGAVLLGLFTLDGVAAFSTHARAPWVELPLAWGACGADLVAAVTAVVAAIVAPRAASFTPTASRVSGA